MRGFDDLFGIGKNSIAGDVCGGVLLSDGKGVACACRGEGFEAEGREDLCGAGVPWIGDDEATRFMKLAKRGDPLACGGHTEPR